MPAGSIGHGGTIAFADPDLGDLHAISQTAIGTPLGTLGVHLDAETSGLTAGHASWSYSVDSSLVDYLSAGETRVESFTVTIADDHGGSVSRQVDVTITGTNDAPVAGADSAETDRSDAITLDLLANDGDVDHLDTLTITGATLSAGLGTVSVAPDGRHVTYFANHQYDGLTSGQSVPVTIGYIVSDNHGGTAAGTATVTVKATNVPPVILPSSDSLGQAVERGDHDAGENVADDGAAGTIRFSDGDPSNTHGASFAPQGANYLGRSRWIRSTRAITASAGASPLATTCSTASLGARWSSNIMT
jgi:VCBS repeat-containing protein